MQESIPSIPKSKNEGFSTQCRLMSVFYLEIRFCGGNWKGQGGGGGGGGGGEGGKGVRERD